MAVMAVWAAVLFLFGTSNGMPLFIEDSGKFQPLNPFSQNMVPDSVDDMYRGCEEEMEEKIKREFLFNEINNNENFEQSWRETEEYYNRYYNIKWKHETTLRKEEIMAIYAYTLEEPSIYREFNDAVRTQKRKYTTTFAYHTLHFYLTSAIKTLNTVRPKEERCFTSYRRVRIKFSPNIFDKKFRFGAFTSSSMGYYANDHFGDKTCFEIYTCFGADISKYSRFESEREVLIPPYEVFKVTKMETRSAANYLPCEVVYHVRSAGRPASGLNCALSDVNDDL